MNGWKVTAIIFIILFIIETCSVVYLIKMGSKQIDNRQYCSSLCGTKDANAFTYDLGTQVCACYDKESKIFYQEVLK